MVEAFGMHRLQLPCTDLMNFRMQRLQLLQNEQTSRIAKFCTGMRRPQLPYLGHSRLPNAPTAAQPKRLNQKPGSFPIRENEQTESDNRKKECVKKECVKKKKGRNMIFLNFKVFKHLQAFFIIFLNEIQ